MAVFDLTGNPPDAYLGVAYSFTPDSSGAAAPVSYAIIAGALPPGLELNTTTGEIYGTPTNPYVAVLVDALTSLSLTSSPTLVLKFSLASSDSVSISSASSLELAAKFTLSASDSASTSTTSNPTLTYTAPLSADVRADTHSAASFDEAVSAIRFNANGAKENVAGSGSQNSYTWRLSGNSDQYDIHFQLISGSLGQGWGAALNTWHNLGTSRETGAWRRSAVQGTGTTTGVIRITIRNTATGAQLDQADVTFNAEIL